MEEDSGRLRPEGPVRPALAGLPGPVAAPAAPWGIMLRRRPRPEAPEDRTADPMADPAEEGMSAAAYPFWAHSRASAQ